MDPNGSHALVSTGLVSAEPAPAFGPVGTVFSTVFSTGGVRVPPDFVPPLLEPPDLEPLAFEPPAFEPPIFVVVAGASLPCAGGAVIASPAAGFASTTGGVGSGLT